MLEALYFADICELIPVVYFRRDFPYTYKSLLKKNDNVIENFFCQPVDITIIKVKKSFRVVGADPFRIGQAPYLVLDDESMGEDKTGGQEFIRIF